jgi:NTP pyrophosphatase (non-canonical NTP hydrolase)
MATLDFKQVQQRLDQFAQERDWEQFQTPKNLVMALAGEAGELLAEFQWLNDAQSHQLSDEKHEAVALEMADIFNYLMLLCVRLDVDLASAVDRKIAINAQRYPAEKVRGSAKKYNEYD